MKKKLSLQARELLMEPRFSIRAPNAFGFEDDCWIDCVPILTQDKNGKFQIAYPSYNTKPTWPDDREAQRALNELHSLLDAVAIDIHIAPGEWVVWNNSEIVHRRGPIGDGPRKLWRNYVRGDCDAMRKATGSNGPIFSARALLDSVAQRKAEYADVG